MSELLVLICFVFCLKFAFGDFGIIIQLNRSETGCQINLAEVELYGGGDQKLTPTSYALSSELPGNPSAVANCFDGIYTNWCHTAGECPGSLEVIASSRPIIYVKVWNRADCCGGRIREATLTYFEFPTASPTTRRPLTVSTFVDAQSVYTFNTGTDFPTGQPSAQPSSDPTSQPTNQPTNPTSQPSRQPSRHPSSQPSGLPTSQPTGQPTRQPTSQPSHRPSCQPSSQPTSQPTRQPYSSPSCQPTSQPSRRPTAQPTRQPTGQPSKQPSSAPSCQPTVQPSRLPTSQPTKQPTVQPSNQPSTQPTAQPVSRPSISPSMQPTSQPSPQPSSQPTRQPSGQPSQQPTTVPSTQPSRRPSAQPSSQPTRQPSTQPTAQPVSRPSASPSMQPTGQPSAQPSSEPTRQPSQPPTSQPLSRPTALPSMQPSTQPSFQPTSHPTRLPSAQPTQQPTLAPSAQPSRRPSAEPTCSPSSQPTSRPSRQPSSSPTCLSSGQPTCQPSETPSGQPSSQPTKRPSSHPTTQPTRWPSGRPSSKPSGAPSCQPSDQPSGQPSSFPSCYPTRQPTALSSAQPSSFPSRQPTRQPIALPSGQPTRQPTRQPSRQPSGQPSDRPSVQPTIRPTSPPSAQPSVSPTSQPSAHPTSQPTQRPTRLPTAQPSAQPSFAPSRQPTGQPSVSPSGQPSQQPSTTPSSVPTSQPSVTPTLQPSMQPSRQPTSQPTSQPSRQPSRQPSSSPTVMNRLADLGNNSTASGSAVLAAVNQLLQSLSPSLIQELLSSFSQSRNTSAVLQQLQFSSKLANTSIALVALAQNRSSSQVSLVSGGSTSVVLSLPASLASDIAGIIAAATVMSASIYQNKTTSFYNQSTSGSSTTPKLNSNLVTVEVTYTKSNGSTSTATLPSFEATVDLIDKTYSTVETTTLEHNCTIGEVSTGSLFCRQSHVWLNATCTGKAASTIRRSCPVSRTVCTVVNVQSGSVASEDYCQAVVYGSGSVLCRCGYGTTTNSTAALLALNGKVTVAAFSSFVAGDLDASVGVIATPLSGDVAAKSMLVFVTFGGLWTAGVLILAAMVYRTPKAAFGRWALTARKVKKQTQPEVDVAAVEDIDAVKDDWPGEQLAGPRARTDLVVSSDRSFALWAQYLHTLLPPVFQGVSWTSRLLAALCARHTLIRLIDQALAVRRVVSYRVHSQRESREKAQRVLLDAVYLVTSLTMSCFVLAVLYDLQYPVDNGYCAGQQASEATCTFRKSLFDPWASRCLWEPVNDDATAATSRTVVAAVVTESQNGKTLSTTTVTPGSDGSDDDSTWSPCQPNKATDSTIAFVFSFLITSVFASLLEVVLEAVFRVLGEATSDADADNDSGHSGGPRGVNGDDDPNGEEMAAGDRLRSRNRHHHVPDAVVVMRQSWIRSLGHGAGPARRVSADADETGLRAAEPASSLADGGVRPLPSQSSREATVAQELSLGIFCAQRWIEASLVQSVRCAHGSSATAVRSRQLLRRSLQRWCEITPPSRSNGHGRWATVAKGLPYLMVALLLTMHAGALYFLVSKAAVRGLAWQRSFFNAVLWEWGTDVSVVQTVEVYVVDLVIPRWFLRRWMAQLHARLSDPSPALAAVAAADADGWKPEDHEVEATVAQQNPLLPEVVAVTELQRIAADSAANRTPMAQEAGETASEGRQEALWRRVGLWLLTVVSLEQLIFVTNIATSASLGVLVLVWYTYLLPWWAGLDWVLWALMAVPFVAALLLWLREQRGVWRTNRLVRSMADVGALSAALRHRVVPVARSGAEALPSAGPGADHGPGALVVGRRRGQVATGGSAPAPQPATSDEVVGKLTREEDKSDSDVWRGAAPSPEPSENGDGGRHPSQPPLSRLSSRDRSNSSGSEFVLSAASSYSDFVFSSDESSASSEASFALLAV